MKIIKNVNLYGNACDIGVENGKIVAIGKLEGEGVDFGGARIFPGLIDTHSHGCIGLDVMDTKTLGEMADWELAQGVTTWYPTTMTMSKESVAAATTLDINIGHGANIPGFHMEGPFINLKYRGAQNPEYIVAPSMDFFNACKNIKRVTLAPEAEGAIEFIKECPAQVSIGHTDADYDTCIKAIEAGATSLTHTYNAMPGIHHRAPGPIGAASDSEGVYCEVICDGVHIHPAAIRLLIKTMGKDRIVLVSDSIRGTALPDGSYDFGGMLMTVKDGTARMENGALGVSFGLTYAPSCYANVDELIALAKVVGEYHGVISAHVRNEGSRVVRSTEEFITVVRESGARGVHSHLKTSGKENWGKSSHVLQMIEQANAEGLDVYADVYPYNASHTSLSATIVPKHLHSGGTPALMKVLESEEGRREIRAYCNEHWGKDWSWVQITICRAYPEYEGKRIPQIAALHGKDEIDTMCDIIHASNNSCSACYFSMCEEDISRVIAFPRAMICTDSGVAGKNNVYHPRLRASFPRAIKEYVRVRGVVTLPEMIRKMTAMPAAVYGLSGKGLLREGMDADICVFDAEQLCDHATFADCKARATGLHYVLVSGEVVVKDAVHNGKRLGRVLRYRG